MTTVSCSSMDDVVKFAIQKEEKAMDFYLKCASVARNPGIRDFFQELAKEEERHRDLLRGLNVDGLDDIKLEKIEDLQISQYLVDVDFKDDMTYQEALTLAMKKEQKAHDFYAAWGNKCGHEKTSRLFQLLAQEEMKHKRTIENKYDDDILSWG